MQGYESFRVFSILTCVTAASFCSSNPNTAGTVTNTGEQATLREACCVCASTTPSATPTFSPTPSVTPSATLSASVSPSASVSTSPSAESRYVFPDLGFDSVVSGSGSGFSVASAVSSFSPLMGFAMASSEDPSAPVPNTFPSFLVSSTFNAVDWGEGSGTVASGNVAVGTFTTSEELELATVVSDMAATPPLNVPTSSAFGSAIAVLPDLDNNGFNELVVGSRGASTFDTASGSVFLLFMGASSTIEAWFEFGLGPTDTQYVNVASVSHVKTWQYFGASVCHADIDGDGSVELLVGMPGTKIEFDADPLEVDTWDGTGGTVFVLSLSVPNGRTGLTSSNVLSSVLPITAADVLSLAGVTVGQDGQFGYALASVGDVDGDGVFDVFVGAPRMESSAGAVFVVSIANDITLASIRRLDTGTISIPAGSRFGSALSFLYDVNADGILELAIGSPAKRSAGDSATSSGSLHVASLGVSRLDLCEHYRVAHSIDLQASGGFDCTDGAVGDPNLLDAVEASIAAQGIALSSVFPPPVRVKYNRVVTADLVGAGLNDGIGLGEAVVLLGDIDNDGRSEVALSAPYHSANAGAVFVLEIATPVPSQSPAPSETPTTSASASQSPSVPPSDSMSPTPSHTTTATTSASPSSSASITASGTSSPTASSSATPTASPSLTVSPSLSASASASLSASPTASASSTQSRSPSSSETSTPSVSPSPTPSATASASNTGTPSNSASGSPSASPSSTRNAPLPSATSTPSTTPSATPTSSDTPSFTATPSSTASSSSSETASVSATPSSSASSSPTATSSESGSATPTASHSATASVTPTNSATETATVSRSASGSASGTASASASVSATTTASETASASRSATSSVSGTVSPSNTPSPTEPRSPSPSASLPPTPSTSPTNSVSATPSRSQGSLEECPWQGQTMVVVEANPQAQQHRVRVVRGDASVSPKTCLGTFLSAEQVALSQGGDVFVADPLQGALWRMSVDTCDTEAPQAVLSWPNSALGRPRAVATVPGADAVVYVGDDASGLVFRVAVDTGVAQQTVFPPQQYRSIVVDADGVVFAASYQSVLFWVPGTSSAGVLVDAYAGAVDIIDVSLSPACDGLYFVTRLTGQVWYCSDRQTRGSCSVICGGGAGAGAGAGVCGGLGEGSSPTGIAVDCGCDAHLVTRDDTVVHFVDATSSQPDGDSGVQTAFPSQDIAIAVGADTYDRGCCAAGTVQDSIVANPSSARLSGPCAQGVNCLFGACVPGEGWCDCYDGWYGCQCDQRSGAESTAAACANNVTERVSVEPFSCCGAGDEGTLFYVILSVLYRVDVDVASGTTSSPQVCAEFRSVSDITIASDGSVFVVDDVAQSVSRVSADCSQVTTISDYPVPHPFVANPVATCIADNSVYVADRASRSVWAIALSSSYAALGFTDTHPPPLTQPSKIAVASTGHVFVVDQSYKILRYAPGALLPTTLFNGLAQSVFSISDMHLSDACGLHFVTDTMHQLWHCPDPFNGSTCHVMCSGGRSCPGLYVPFGIAVDCDCNVYVGNRGDGTVVRYSADGTSVVPVLSSVTHISDLEFLGAC